MSPNHKISSFLVLTTMLIFINMNSSIPVSAYRVRHIRLCIQSVDQSKLASQCVYCRNRIFPLTVRVCTSNNYLPARMTVNEGYCLINACRRQLPKMSSEPYQESGNPTSIVGHLPHSIMTPSSIEQQLQLVPNRNEPIVIGSSNGHTVPVQTSGSAALEPVNSETGNDYDEAESVQANAKARPPARFFVGKPQKLSLFKFRPIFYG